MASSPPLSECSYADSTGCNVQDATRLRTIAVIGDDANDNPVFRGEGSGEVSAEYVVTPLEVLPTHPHRSMPWPSQVCR
jgi:hypothetical protein